MLTDYFPVLVFLGIAAAVTGAFWATARLLGPKVDTATKNIPYECGQDPADSPRTRFSISFYRTAILFLVFDIEAAFFYPWAILYRDLSCKGTVQSGICYGGATAFGLVVMAVFMSILVLALLYVWRRKALEWD